jgi:hypothetical protein
MSKHFQISYLSSSNIGITVDYDSIDEIRSAFARFAEYHSLITVRVQQFQVLTVLVNPSS